MVYPPVSGDNPQALANGLFSVHVDNHGITSFYTNYISLAIEHYTIVCPNVGKGGIFNVKLTGIFTVAPLWIFQ